MKINGQKIKADSSPVTNEPRQVTTNRYAINVLSNENDIRTRNSQINIKEIPVELIKGRDVNNYIISDIETLAKSIEQVGQLQEIIVRVDHDSTEESYICVAGHRRLEAFKFLKEKFLNKYNDPTHKMVLLYSYIRARVMTSEEELNEEIIYDDTNSKTRIPTVFEALLRFDLDAIDFEKESVRKDYVTLVYGENKYKEYLDGSLKIKFNQSTKYAYLQKLIEENFPSMHIGLGSIKNYYSMIQSSSPLLISSVLSGKIPLREAISISRESHEKQKELIESYGTSDYEKRTQLKKEASVKEVEDDDAVDYEKLILKTKKNFEELNRLNEKLSNLQKKELNGNQKELIKELKKLTKIIEKINGMPIK